MDKYIYQLINNSGFLTGLEKELPNDFKQIYALVKSEWGMDSTRTNNMLKFNDSIFICREKGTEKVLGFLFGNTAKSKSVGKSFIDKWINADIQRLDLRCQEWMNLIKAESGKDEYMKGNNMNPAFPARLRSIIVDKRYRGHHIGLSLFNSFMKAITEDVYVGWQTDAFIDYNFYIKNDLGHMMSCDTEGQMIFLTGKTQKKKDILKEKSCWMPFPEGEYTNIIRQLKKIGYAYTTRVSDEKDRYKVGYEYYAPFGAVITIEDKKLMNCVEEHPFFKQLSTSQINELQKYDKDGIVVYKFSKTYDNIPFWK